jgi:phospholipase C
MFQSNIGASFAAHLYIFSGTSLVGGTGQYADDFAYDNGTGEGIKEELDYTGCSASSDQTISVLKPTGNYTDTPNGSVYPCFDHPTMSDVLDAAGLSWTYYTSSATDLWAAPNAYSNVRSSPSFLNMVTPSNTFLSDLINRNYLANVTWVIPPRASSDHDMLSDGSGPSWVSAVVNAVGESQYWNNTAIIVTWDDWGGFYDHVPPPGGFINSNEPGLRVPLLVISPYAKKKYISHTFYTFGSVLRFVETVFKLPTIGSLAGKEYADGHRGINDMTDCFDFTQAPSAFTPIQAPLDINYFMNNPATADDGPLDTE